MNDPEAVDLLASDETMSGPQTKEMKADPVEDFYNAVTGIHQVMSAQSGYQGGGDPLQARESYQQAIALADQQFGRATSPRAWLAERESGFREQVLGKHPDVPHLMGAIWMYRRTLERLLTRLDQPYVRHQAIRQVATAEPKERPKISISRRVV